MDVDGNPFPKKEFSSSSSVQFNPLLSHFYYAELKIASEGKKDFLDIVLNIVWEILFETALLGDPRLLSLLFFFKKISCSSFFHLWQENLPHFCVLSISIAIVSHCHYLSLILFHSTFKKEVDYKIKRTSYNLPTTYLIIPNLVKLREIDRKVFALNPHGLEVHMNGLQCWHSGNIFHQSSLNFNFKTFFIWN